MRIELLGMPFFTLEFKPKQKVENIPQISYNNCVLGRPFVVTVPQIEKKISGKELEEARKDVIEHVFLKTGIDKSTIELVLITTDNYFEGQ